MARRNPPAAVLNGPGVRVTLSLTTDGNIQQMTQAFNLGTIGPPTLLDLNNFALAWLAQNQTPLANTQPTDTTFTSLTVSEVWYGVTPTFVSNYASGVVGTQTGGHHPLETAATGIWRTNLKGQHGRGRIQFPNVPISFVNPATDANNLTPTAITLYIAALNSLMTPLTTSLGSWIPVVIQRPIPPLVLVSQATQITSFTFDKLLGTQRRRKAGRGI